MNPDFAAVGLTIAAGAITILGTYAVLVWGLCPQLRLRLPLAAEKQANLLGAAIGIALILAVGLFVENLSKSLVGNPPPFSAQIWKPLGRVLPSDAQLRADQVLKNVDGRLSLHRIGYGLARTKTFALHGGKNGAYLDAALDNPEILSELTEKDAQRAAQQVFYAAKNVLYTQSTYFAELRVIESRMAFARTVCFAFAVFLVLTLAGLAWAVLSRFLFPKIELLTSPSERVERHNLFVIRFWRLAALAVLAAAFLICARMIYIAEQFNYNVRVFGYYETMRAEAANSPGSSSDAE